MNQYPTARLSRTQIVSYLAYEIKYGFVCLMTGPYFKDEEDTLSSINIHTGRGVFLRISNGETYFSNWSHKPLLYPLTEKELTKPRIIENQRTCMLDFITTDNIDYDITKKFLLNDLCGELSNWKIQALLKYHFDIYRLIDNELAFDLNEWNKDNPVYTEKNIPKEEVNQYIKVKSILDYEWWDKYIGLDSGLS